MEDQCRYLFLLLCAAFVLNPLNSPQIAAMLWSGKQFHWSCPVCHAQAVVWEGPEL